MFLKSRAKELFTFVKSKFGFIYFAIYQGILLITGLIKNKYFASEFSVEGTGTISQINSSVFLIGSIAILGIPSSLIKYNAGRSKEQVEIPGLLLFISVLSLVLLSLIIPLPEGLSRVSLVVLSLFYVMDQYAVGYLQSTQNIAAFTRVKVVSLFVVILIVLLFQLENLTNALIIFNLFPFLLTIILVGKAFRWKLSKRSEIVEILKTSSVFLLSGIIFNFLSYFTKNILISTQHEIGLYQAAYVIAISYPSLFFTAIIMDFYPKLAKLKTEQLQQNYLLKSAVLYSAILLVFSLFLLGARSELLSILFTNEFFIAEKYIRYMLIFSSFKVSVLLIGYVNIVKNKLSSFLFAEVLTLILQFVLLYISYDKFGLGGLALVSMMPELIKSVCYVSWPAEKSWKVVYFKVLLLAIPQPLLLMLWI